MKENYQKIILDWKKDQIELRRKYRDTPAGFKNVKQEKSELDSLHQAEIIYKASLEYKIQNEPITWRDFHFVGREKEMKNLRGIITKKHCAFLYGIGGIGKTTIALEYARRFGKDYNHILVVIINDSLEKAIADDNQINITNLSYQKEKYKTDKKYYQVKFDILKHICEKEKVLIIFDNCNLVKENAISKVLELGCDKIFTTRIDYEMVDSTNKIKVEALPQEDLELLIRSNWKDDINESDINELMSYGKKVSGHTLSILLASAQKKHGKLTMDVLQDQNIKNLVSAFKLNQNEKETLLYMAIMPPQGVPKNLFLLVAQKKEQEIARLKKYLLIDVRHNTSFPGDNEWMMIHPVIAETVRTLSQPTCRNCSRLLRGFEGYMNGELTGEMTWDRLYEVNHMLEPYILALYNTFQEPVAWLSKAFEEVVTFLWIMGYFNEAEKYALKIYNEAYAYYKNDNEIPGREALRVAAVYHNRLMHKEALEWYLKGYSLLKDVKNSSFDLTIQLILVCGKLARDARNRKDLDAQNKYFNEFEIIITEVLNDRKITDEQREKLYLEYYYCLLEKAKYMYEDGDIENAFATYNEINDWLQRQEDFAFRRVGFDDFYILLLIKDGKLNEAKEIACANVEKTYKYRGEKYKDYHIYREKLADVLVLCGEIKNAVSIYKNIIINVQKDYSYETKWVERVLDKIINISLNC